MFAFAALMLAASGVTGAQDGDRGQAAGRENGWYRIIDGVADSIAPRPVLTVKEFAELRLDTNYFGNPVIIGRASRRKVRAWADSTDAITGHRLGFVVDGQVVNIPSYSVKPGQIVGVREKAKSLEVIEAALAGFNHSKYPWIEWDENTKSGKLLHKPERADIPENIKEQLIVELYSK